MTSVQRLLKKLHAASLAVLLALTANMVQAQDVIPSSVDLRMVPGGTSDELLVQVKFHSTADFGGILSALTVTIRYDNASGSALGAGTSFCANWSAFPPSAVVVDNGIAYRTYNGFGLNRLEDTPFNGGCGVSIVPETWFTISTIPVAGSNCTEFTVGNDAYTQANNRNFYISVNGQNVTGTVIGGPVNAGVCALDCLGVPGGTATIGSACDDGDPNTGNDVYDANCVCAGQLYDCLGVPGGTATIGTACDDGDPNTGNDVYDANCVCAGQAIDCLGVPGGTATIGSACDDGDPNTGNDIYDANCVCAGQAIDCLGVPGGTATIGTACDDGDPNTGNDVYDANCVCAGQLYDCLGVPGGTATIGSACDDGDPNTGGDIYDANCVCAGQAIDCLGVPGGTATIGTACDDGDPNTGNDVYDANCVCAGSPVGTLDCEGVLNGPALPGTSCDDGNAATINDTWNANCVCTGTLVGPCGGDQVVVVINTDDNGAQITWEITDGTNNVIAAGGPAAGQDNMLVSETVCLGSAPSSTCYGFRLMDSFGDGIVGGGWELRTTSGKLLLRDDFATGANSPSVPPMNPGYGSTHGFCLPPGPANIAPTECGIFTNTLLNKVYCNKVAGASMYQFEFSDPDAGFRRWIARNRNYVIFNEMVSVPLTPGVKYFARVRTDRDGPLALAHFGAGCEMGLGVAQAVPCTELIHAPAYGHSCDETRTFNTNNSFIYAKPVVGATEYQFRLINTQEGYDQTFIRSTYILQLKWNGNVAPLLQDGYTYNVQINVKVNGLYSGFCSSDCDITIDNSGNRPAASMVQANGQVTLWPNPVRDGQVHLSIEGLTDADQKITVDVQDIYGKQVFAQEFGNTGERFNTILDLSSDIASGVYMVHITVNGESTVQRLSIIK